MTNRVRLYGAHWFKGVNVPLFTSFRIERKGIGQFHTIIKLEIIVVVKDLIQCWTVVRSRYRHDTNTSVGGWITYEVELQLTAWSSLISSLVKNLTCVVYLKSSSAFHESGPLGRHNRPEIRLLLFNFIRLQKYFHRSKSTQKDIISIFWTRDLL